MLGLETQPRYEAPHELCAASDKRQWLSLD